MTAAIFAILVGLAGAYAVRQYLKEAPVVAQAAAEPEFVTVPIASSDLMDGRQLTINDVTLLRMTREELQQSQYANQAFMQNTSQSAGRILRGGIKKGEAFFTNHLYPEGMGPGVAERLKPGQRAVTVAIENVGAVEGYARPGTLVDVLFRSTESETLPEVTITLLEAVEILAVGRVTLPGHDVAGDVEKTTVTVGVTPQQAKALKVVEGRGEMTLALRASDDVGQVISVGNRTQQQMTLTQLLGLPERSAKKMEIYRGADKQIVEFEQPVANPGGPLGGFISTPIAAEEPRQHVLPSQPVSQTQSPSSNIADRSGS
jgi:pilus assembly protein CpaB